MVSNTDRDFGWKIEDVVDLIEEMSPSFTLPGVLDEVLENWGCGRSYRGDVPIFHPARCVRWGFERHGQPQDAWRSAECCIVPVTHHPEGLGCWVGPLIDWAGSEHVLTVCAVTPNCREGWDCSASGCSEWSHRQSTSPKLAGTERTKLGLYRQPRDWWKNVKHLFVPSHTVALWFFFQKNRWIFRSWRPWTCPWAARFNTAAWCHCARWWMRVARIDTFGRWVKMGSAVGLGEGSLRVRDSIFSSPKE